jgi:hypothetical protein
MLRLHNCTSARIATVNCSENSAVVWIPLPPSRDLDKSFYFQGRQAHLIRFLFAKQASLQVTDVVLVFEGGWPVPGAAGSEPTVGAPPFAVFEGWARKTPDLNYTFLFPSLSRVPGRRAGLNSPLCPADCNDTSTRTGAISLPGAAMDGGRCWPRRRRVTCFSPSWRRCGAGSGSWLWATSSCRSTCTCWSANRSAAPWPRPFRC